MIDLVIISVPGVVSRLPPAAPALLKASVESAGFSCRTIDYSIRLYQEDVDIDALETYFSTGLNTECKPIAEKIIETWVKDLLSFNPRYIGISVFTYQNRIATELFCQAIRKVSDAKIVLGGQGLSDGGIEGACGFGKKMTDKNLADFYIRSEGEVSLVELLKNNTTYPGINSNSFKQIDDLDSLPFPNYDDYEIDQYKSPILPITGSRGCVRSCSFCDIHEHWKYRYRSGQSMADEIIYLNQQYSVNNFNFTDSLINGNLREFKKFTKILAEYNSTRTQKITWNSQFIVRSDKEVNEEYWKDAANSGAKNLYIGVETGSDSVRHHMNKKFNNQDLDYTMKMLEKYKITCTFLMIVGYPTETDQDFQETLDMFTKYKYLAPHIIVDINVGSTMSILPGTPLYYQADELNLELDKYENNWVALDNPDLTLDKRLERRAKLKQHLLDSGYHLRRDSTEHMMQILDNKKEMFKKRLELKKIIKIKNIS
jgi:radical SAM superfamily enzyme YgiQ (UPF0313 family)